MTDYTGNQGRVVGRLYETPEVVSGVNGQGRRVVAVGECCVITLKPLALIYSEATYPWTCELCGQRLAQGEVQ